MILGRRPNAVGEAMFTHVVELCSVVRHRERSLVLNVCEFGNDVTSVELIVAVTVVPLVVEQIGGEFNDLGVVKQIGEMGVSRPRSLSVGGSGSAMLIVLRRCVSFVNDEAGLPRAGSSCPVSKTGKREGGGRRGGGEAGPLWSVGGFDPALGAVLEIVARRAAEPYLIILGR